MKMGIRYIKLRVDATTLDMRQVLILHHQSIYIYGINNKFNSAFSIIMSGMLLHFLTL